MTKVNYMRKLTILIDLDATVVDLHPTWYSKYNERYGDDLSMERVTSWNTHLYAKAGKAIYQILREPGLYRHLPALPGALEATQELKKMGHRLVIVTSAPRFTHSDKAAWVDQYMPWVDHEDVFMGGSKYLVFGDVLIDDGPHNIKEYREQWGFYPLLCAISHPYNQEINGVADLMAQDWKDTKAAWSQIVSEIEYFSKQDIRRDIPRKTDHGFGISGEAA